MVVYLVWTAGGYVSGDNGECRTPEAGRAKGWKSFDDAASVAEMVGGRVVDSDSDGLS